MELVHLLLAVATVVLCGSQISLNVPDAPYSHIVSFYYVDGCNAYPINVNVETPGWVRISDNTWAINASGEAYISVSWAGSKWSVFMNSGKYVALIQGDSIRLVRAGQKITTCASIPRLEKEIEAVIRIVNETNKTVYKIEEIKPLPNLPRISVIPGPCIKVIADSPSSIVIWNPSSGSCVDVYGTTAELCGEGISYVWVQGYGPIPVVHGAPTPPTIPPYAYLLALGLLVAFLYRRDVMTIVIGLAILLTLILPLLAPLLGMPLFAIVIISVVGFLALILLIKMGS